jgi:hypothetical protein
MSSFTVSTVEVWGTNHTTEAGKPADSVKYVNTYLERMQALGHLENHVGTFSNITVGGVTTTANVIYNWDSVESANAYLTFISNLSPISAAIA